MFNPAQSAYVDLRSRIAERTDSVVAWIGSGLSAPAGLPTWQGLRTALLTELDNKAGTLEPKAAGFLKAKAQVVAYEPNLWTALDILKDGLGDATFVSAVRKVLSPA